MTAQHTYHSGKYVAVRIGTLFPTARLSRRLAEGPCNYEINTEDSYRVYNRWASLQFLAPVMSVKMYWYPLLQVGKRVGAIHDYRQTTCPLCYERI